jgi:hypothetical protein
MADSPQSRISSAEGSSIPYSMRRVDNVVRLRTDIGGRASPVSDFSCAGEQVILTNDILLHVIADDRVVFATELRKPPRV